MHPYLDLLAVFPPLAGAVVAGFFGRVIGDRLSQLVTCLGLLIALAASVVIFQDVALGHAVMDRTLFTWIKSANFDVNWQIHIDTLTAVMLIVVNGVSAMVHIYSIGYMAHDKSIPRFMAYLSLFTFFMLALVTADNLVQMFFGWEGVGLASYLLINFWFEKDSANNAAIKAFIVNRVGDFGFALGIFGCFLIFNSVKFDEIFSRASELAALRFMFLGHSVPALTTVCLLLFMGAMGKSAQLGLHTWLPDAMEGPTPVSALIHAATMVTAGVFMVARLSPLFEFAPDALAVVTIIGALTCFIAGTIGLTQFDIKRVIAYSTMSQLGYMFFGLGVSAYSAAIFHLMTHAFFKALLFLCAGSVIHAMSGEQDMRKMGGIWKKIPVTYVLMWIGSLALAGIGLEDVFGMAGFYSKDLILESAIAHGGFTGMTAYVLGTITVFFTAFYSWRLLILTFHGKPRATQHVMEHVHESPWIMLLPLIPLAIGSIFAGWYAWDWFGGNARFTFWAQAIYVLPQDDSIAASARIPEYERWLPLGVALPGILFAYICYMWKTDLPGKIAAAFGGIYRLVYNKYYFDELYDRLFVKNAWKLGKLFWHSGDDGIIDGYGPDGIARLAGRVAKRVGAWQTGYVYHYAFAMVVGVAAFAAWFWARG
jgi:NADH-quinone oxidoreductase subunit L